MSTISDAIQTKINETSKDIVLELFTGLHLKVGHGLFQTINHVFQVIFVVIFEAYLTRLHCDCSVRQSASTPRTNGLPFLPFFFFKYTLNISP